MQFLPQFLTSPPKFEGDIFMNTNIALPPLKIRNINIDDLSNEKIDDNFKDINDSESSSSDENSYKSEKEKMIQSLKERNRVAAKKWRKKKEQYLTELEQTNDSLRQQAFHLCLKVKEIGLEVRFLEKEVNYFQVFMAKMMYNPSY